MPRAPKKCGEFGCEERVVGRTYCPQHVRSSPSSLAAQNYGERARRRAAVLNWVATFGWICPGFQRDPHPSTDLTAAHSIAVARGGSLSPLGVLCRSCNSRQNTRPA